MQKGREVRDNVFDSSGFGLHRSMMMPSLFGGRDPFDDPFFTDPFDTMWGPSSTASRAMQKTNRDKGVVIKELGSDDEGTDHFPETGEEGNSAQRISRSALEPSVEHPDDDDNDDVNEKKNSGATYKNEHYKSEPQKGSNFCFSRVTYGGIDGAYYTSTRTRKIGADGVVMEDKKEADSTTGQAAHRITRGIQDKGHSILRKLDSDGKVDTTQTLHNLNEDELAGFDEAWKGNNLGKLPEYNVHRKKDSRVGELNKNQFWSLPSLEQTRRAREGSASNYETGNNSGGRTKKVVRINIE